MGTREKEVEGGGGIREGGKWNPQGGGSQEQKEREKQKHKETGNTMEGGRNCDYKVQVAGNSDPLTLPSPST